MFLKPNNNQRSKSQQLALPVIVLLVGIIASGYLFYLTRELNLQRAEEDFSESANSHNYAIEEEVNANLELLSSLGAFVENTSGLQQRNFGKFASTLVRNHGNIQALEWIPRIANNARAAHEVEAREQGFANYTIKARGTDGAMASSAQAPEYFPVYFVYPKIGNEAATGFDLASNPARLAALNEATDSGALVMTPRITLVQEKGSQAGLLIFKPLYKNGITPTSIENRRENLIGFSLIVIRVGDMIVKSTLHLQSDITFQITDITDSPEGTLLFGDPLPQSVFFTKEFTHSFAGRTWLVSMAPAPGAYDFSTSLSSWLTLFGALFATSLASLFVFRLSMENQKIAREVHKQTEALRVSEERYALSIDGAAVGLWDWNVITNELFWSHRLMEIIGVKDINFIADSADFENRIHPDDKENVLQAVQNHLANREVYDIVYRLRRESGHYAWIHAKGQALWNKAGDAIRMAGSMDDISNRLNLEKALETNRNELQLIFDNVPARIVYKDDKNNILRLNQKAADAMCMKVEDVEGANTFDLFPDDAEKYLEDDLSVIRSGEPSIGVVKKSSSTENGPSWTRTDKIPFIDPDSGHKHLLISTTDITALIEAEEAKITAIKAQNKTATELEAIFDTVADGLIIITLEGTIRQLNPASVAIFGYTKKELTDQNFSVLLPGIEELEKETYLENFHNLDDKNSIHSGRTVVGKRKNGVEFPMSLNIGRIDIKNKQIGYVGIVRDITTQVAAAEKLAESEERFMLAAEGSSVGIWDSPNIKEDKQY